MNTIAKLIKLSDKQIAKLFKTIVIPYKEDLSFTDNDWEMLWLNKSIKKIEKRINANPEQYNEIIEIFGLKEDE